MKKYLLIISTVAALLSFFGCKTTSKEAVQIKFNLPKGSKYEYAVDIEMAMDQKAAGKDVKVRNSIGTTYDFEVLGDSSGWKTVSSTIGRFSMDMDAMGNTMHFDTDMPGDTTGPAGIMAKVFGLLKGMQFSFTVNDDGKIGEVRGVAEMQEKMLASLNIPNAEEVMQGLKGGFSDESLRQNMQQAFVAYPGKPVRPGDSWSKSMTEEMQGIKMNLDNNFTLESVNGDDAVIKVSSKLNSPDGEAVNGTRVKLDGTSEGTMHYSLATGMTTDATTNMDLNMKVSAEGTEMPVSLKIKMITKGKKI